MELLLMRSTMTRTQVTQIDTNRTSLDTVDSGYQAKVQYVQVFSHRGNPFAVLYL